ncbi:MAG: T9SS type A sorting domain-containing protein, partial [Chitinophagaceae bacterium]
TQPDRDWRYIGVVLPIQFLGFNGNALGNTALLNWSIIATNAIDRFEIERSADNNIFIKTGTVRDNVLLNQSQTFSFNDDISTVSSNIIYYRLKVIGKAGEIKYSNILIIIRIQTKNLVTVMPNPTGSYSIIRFFVEKESTITLRLMDNLGKSILIQEQRVLKGNNSIQLTGLGKYSSGVYTLQININNEIVTQRLIISK